MTTVEPDEQGKTARIEQLAPSPPPAQAEPHEAAPPQFEPPASVPVIAPERPPDALVRPGSPRPDVVYVPMSVNVGDGFKFGCGFFLALVMSMLIGFVLVAALFALTNLFGFNLPIGR